VAFEQPKSAVEQESVMGEGVAWNDGEEELMAMIEVVRSEDDEDQERRRQQEGGEEQMLRATKSADADLINAPKLAELVFNLPLTHIGSEATDCMEEKALQASSPRAFCS
jgi:hypothetical protein